MTYKSGRKCRKCFNTLDKTLQYQGTITYFPADETSPSFVKWSRLLAHVWRTTEYVQ